MEYLIHSQMLGLFILHNFHHFGPEGHPIWGLIGFLFLVFLLFNLIIIKRRRISNREKVTQVKDSLIVNTDILGLEKSYSHDTSSFSPLKKSLDWRILLLAIFVIIGFSLIYKSNKRTTKEIRNFNATSIEAARENSDK